MSIQWSTAPQGTEEWLAARRGVITASRFRDCRDKLKTGELTEKAKLYAMDVARERIGGQPEAIYQTAAMRFGSEQEPIARVAYEDATGNLVEQVGFCFTEDRKFGGSVDGLIDPRGLWECKVMVSSKTLFKAVVDGDISEYRDQCIGNLWLLGRHWCDLTLWAPDLPDGKLTIIRIERDDNEIERLEADLLAFERLVTKYEAALRKQIGQPPSIPKPIETPPWNPPATGKADIAAPAF